MEAMTPEERFTKIENLLATVTENQLRHDAAIRDLIVVSRTTLNAIGELLEGQKGLQESQIGLQESQKATDDKLHILIETVDRIIRNQQK
jgi:hypothetical protein